MADQNLLVVEDDAQTAQAIQRALAELNLPVRRVPDLHAARDEISRQRPDLIVLDRLLPEGDSLDWLAQLRAAAQEDSLQQEVCGRLDVKSSALVFPLTLHSSV